MRQLLTSIQKSFKTKNLDYIQIKVLGTTMDQLIDHITGMLCSKDFLPEVAHDVIAKIQTMAVNTDKHRVTALHLCHWIDQRIELKNGESIE